MAPAATLALPTRENFPSFPYLSPYAIQLDLMRHVYSSIENGRVAIVESPTGTGKTLSLLCSTLTWLADDRERQRHGQLQVLQQSLQGDHEPEWVLEQTLARHKRELEAAQEEMDQRLEKARRKEAAFRRMAKARVHKKQKLAHDPAGDKNDDSAFLPEDVFSGDDEPDNGLSPTVKALMKRFAYSRDAAGEEEPACTKIYYASRTHSQLSQVHGELLKTTYASSRVVPLASRKSLCINDELRAKGNEISSLDEGCRELLSGGRRCPYLPPHDEEHKMLDFRDHVLATPKDIEDLVAVGRELRICPYFGSRRAIPQAELVALPYNLLLQKTAREALGIDLTNNVVVIDEAHNLIDTLLSIHTVTLSSSIIDISIQQLSVYLTRFRTRLAPVHGLHLRRLLRFLHALATFLGAWNINSAPDAQELMLASNLMTCLGGQAEGINLLEIERYLKHSKIARKVCGYSANAAEKSGQDPSKSRRRMTPPLHAVENFIVALCNSDVDGRLTLSSCGPPGSTAVLLKYQLLNPSNHFKNIVDSARAVILAGGTMSPIGDFRLQLFPFLQEGRFSVFSCGHVIPRDNLKTLVIGRGPRGGELQFKYESRSDPKVLDELGQVLANLVNIVPQGLVVFFPSYAFLNSVKAAFASSGLFERLKKKKKVFFEPEGTVEVDDLLRQYALAVSSENLSMAGKKGGAILFAVIGAKLSEGINFSDSLARAVVVVGMPFPSLASLELKERMRYVNELEKSLGMAPPGTIDAGTELYENLCMRSVNQSIGRAIRHKNDYASLILIDKRYSLVHIKSKLPRWIGQDIVLTQNFGEAIKEVVQFFHTKL